MTSFGFPALLLYISDQISEEQLDKLKYLVQDVIGKRERERLGSGRDLFQLLTERSLLSADNTDYLVQLLNDIGRNDLSERLQGLQGAPNPQETTVGPEEAKLNAAMEILCENVGRSWRKLGRKLGLSEVALESIAQRHPTDLEETTMELLKVWRRRKGGDAQTQDLLHALRSCQLNMTADKLEDKLSAMDQ